MRGDDLRQDQLFSYISTEDRIPAHHPLRKLWVVVNGILEAMSAEFAPLYSDVGRPSIPPEQSARRTRSSFQWLVGVNDPCVG
jgi:hypothetical protein